MKKKLIIVGAYGSGQIAMSVFEDINKVTNEWDILGYVNDVVKIGDSIGAYKVIGDSSSIQRFVNNSCYIHYTYHFNVSSKKERIKTLELLKIPTDLLATGIHPKAYLNPMSKIGRGSLMLPFSSTSSGAVIGDYCHLYTNSFVGHDSYLGNYSTMAAHSILGARIKVGKGVHIGLNSSIREDLTIGDFGIVGMGSTVLKNIGIGEVHVGSPAKCLNKN